MPDLSGSIAVVTGGARGLGLSTAHALAECGASIGLIDVLPEVCEVATSLAQERGVQAVGVIADVRNAQEVEAAVDHLQQQLGTPDVLVTSAGITSWGDSTEVTPDEWQRVLDINLNGTFFAAQSFARRLLAERRSGSVIFFSSMSGRIVNIPQFQASYNSSKAAVSMLAKSLAWNGRRGHPRECTRAGLHTF